MRVKPEQVLEKNGIAAERWIEDTDPRHALKREQQNCDRNYRSGQDEDEAGGVLSPNEKRQAKPGHARRPHGMNRDNKV